MTCCRRRLSLSKTEGDAIDAREMKGTGRA
jgi:hypothetical protein